MFANIILSEISIANSFELLKHVTRKINYHLILLSSVKTLFITNVSWIETKYQIYR